MEALKSDLRAVETLVHDYAGNLAHDAWLRILAALGYVHSDQGEIIAASRRPVEPPVAVAWRWRLHPATPWHLESQDPCDDEVEVQPLYAAPPAPVPGEGEDKGNHDCLAKRRPGEPMFILLGRDPDAHNIVRMWAERRLAAGGDPEHCQMGLDTSERMKAYAADPANRPASAPDASAYAPAHSAEKATEGHGAATDPRENWAFTDEFGQATPAEVEQAIAILSMNNGDLAYKVQACFAVGGAFAAPNPADGDLAACAREAGWALSENVDRLPWERRGRIAAIVQKLGAALLEHEIGRDADPLPSRSDQGEGGGL